MDPNQQQLLLTSGGAKSSTYVDDVFSTYVYRGNAGTQAINNGIELSSEGGLVWIKRRDGTNGHRLTDTVRGVTKAIVSESNAAETTEANGLTAFNNNGFTLGDSDYYNGGPNDKLTSWTFRKQEGFFDIVTYTGNGSNRTISHSLGSVPGCVIVKRLENSANWAVYHRGCQTTGAGLIQLNDNGGVNTSATDIWNNTAPTSTHFSVGTSQNTNGNGETYVAYVFAGGGVPNTTDNAVDLDGSGDYLSLPANSDLELDGDFTIEGWVNVDVNGWNGTRQTFFANSIGWTTNHAGISLMNSGSSSEQNCITVWSDQGQIATSSPVTVTPSDGWTHIAVTRSGSSVRIFKNGAATGTPVTYSDTFHFGTGATWIGAITMSTGATPEVLDGEISNLRVVKGQCLYDTNFNVPSDPLTQTSQGAISSNVKLLCCNGSTTTASTVTPGTITANGDPTVTTNNSIFDDTTAGNIFGEEGDQGIIKCGSYTGNGATSGPLIDLGWEPQWVLIKASDRSAEWSIVDCIRGIVTGGNDAALYPNATDAEVTSYDIMDVNATGFQLNTNVQLWNQDTKHYVYMAIRRPDGYVGKPAEAGTDAFAMGVGGNSPLPSFAANFPVDYTFTRDITSTAEMYSTARLMEKKYLVTQTNASETSSNAFVFDYNLGCCGSGLNNTFRAWMWKRGAGFDVVTYKGNATLGREVPHSLNAVPEMMWVKNRDSGEQWYVYHKDNSSTPATKALNLNSTGTSQSGNWLWNSTMPTSTVFTLGNDGSTNGNGHNMIAMLFASVDGISKVGSYTGATAGVTVTTGFQPRFLILKNTMTSSNWTVLDTTRGWGSGNDERLYLNTTAAQSAFNVGAPTSTGFTIINNWDTQGDNIIYYAHA